MIRCINDFLRKYLPKKYEEKLKKEKEDNSKNKVLVWSGGDWG